MKERTVSTEISQVTQFSWRYCPNCTVVGKGFRYIRLTFEGDHMIGALTLGRTDSIGVLRGLIHTPISLGPWKERLMAEPAKFVEAYIDRTQVI